MKLISISALVLSISMLCSCGGKEENSKTGDSAKTGGDTVATVKLSPEMEALSARFKASDTWPYKVDSLRIEDITKADSLSAAEVKILSSVQAKHELTDAAEWDLKSFYKIDSIKSKNGYAKYCEGLDIGMIKYANAYALDKLVMDEHTTLLVWGLRTESYEACPYSHDKSVYFTIIRDGAVSGGFLLGRLMGAADAPVYMNAQIQGNLEKDGRFTLEARSINNDEGSEDFEMLEKARYTGQVTDGKLGAVTDVKEKPVKVAIKKS
ncbi:MAG: hypothetical protein FD123_3293 [Bacteroidetes bacterium]|nr:MAG: hypothetical protein FD123_3293 [Bacteroidota bacterium]